MLILDANAILRYLLRDVPEMSEEAREAIMAGASTTAEVLAEVVYVLAGYHHMENQDVMTFDRKLRKALLNNPLTE